MQVWRPAMMVVGLLILSACSERPGIPHSFGEHDLYYGKSHGFSIGRLFRPTPVGKSPWKIDPDPCGMAAGERTAGVDWSKARVVELTIEEGWISPIIVNLKKGQPYILRYVNRDEETRALRGQEFFRATAVAGLRVGDKDLPPSCITSVHAAPKQTVELRIVPEVEGDYELVDNLVIWSLPHTMREGFSLVSVQ